MLVRVVEDSQEVARLLEVILQRAGVTVEKWTADFDRLFDDGAWEGVTHLVCDLMLPGVDGEAIVRHVAAQHPDIVRVVVSAVAHHRQLDDVAVPISKPMDIRHLLNALGLRDE